MPTVDKDPNNEKLSDELKLALRDITDICMREDSWLRKRKIKIWKKAEEFWEGNQFVFWSANRMEWLTPETSNQSEENREDAGGPFYDYVVNIYRAHGESIIAALSAQVPAVRFPPDDADSCDDIITSKTYSKIAELIQRHNKIKLVLLKSLFLAWNQGTFYSYHAPKSDKAFGTTQIPQYEKIKTCPYCEAEQGTEESGIPETPMGMPEGSDTGNLDTYNNPGIPEMGEIPDPNICPQCGTTKIDKVAITGFSDIPKRRITIEIYGGLNVKVPFKATDQKDFGYLSLIVDRSKDFLMSIYPHVAEEIEKENSHGEEFEKEYRSTSSTSSPLTDDENNNDLPLHRIWIQPWRYNLLPPTKDKEKAQLVKKYPNGCFVAWAGKTYLESRNEDYNKYWTVGIPGLSSTTHTASLGHPLMSIQELRNVLLNLTEETIENGIPSGYADTRYLNFDVYSKHEVRPGTIFPIKVPDGHRAADGFYETGRATLSKEVPVFGDQLDKDGQFVVGSFPSIYGGPGEGNSRTAAEYNMSRQMALQRLSITWSLINIWFANLMEKCVKLFIETMIEDERYVQKNKGNYVNVWIRQAELTGRVGEVEPEGSETFPVTSPQKQDLLLKLLGMNNDFLNAAIFHIENRRTVADVLAYPDLYVPDDDQRTKQMKEIYKMVAGTMVEIEPEVDDDQVHIDTLKGFMVGEEGLDLKDTDPTAYELCKMHLAEHQQSLQMKAMTQFEGSAPGQQPNQAPVETQGVQ